MKLTAEFIVFNFIIAVNIDFGATHQDESQGNGEKEISMEELGDWLASMKNWTDVETNILKNITSGSRDVDISGIKFLLFYNYNYSNTMFSGSSCSVDSTNSNQIYCWTEIKKGDLSTIPISFDPSHPIKFLVHGWCQSWTRHFPQVVIKSYLMKKSEANIIVVDWESLATICTCSAKERDIGTVAQGAELFSHYYRAVENMPAVGTHIAEFIRFLNLHGYTTPENSHCIGHSLGAHVCGYAGEAVIKTMNSRSIGRITGLDPAGILFYTNTVGKRLSSRDAAFVDVIHTDDRLLGNYYTMGHVDFYPNGGHAYQPSCADILFDAINLGPMQIFQLICEYKYTNLLCSHMKSATYFAMSLFSEIPAYRCAEVAFAMTNGGNLCDPTPSLSVVMGEYCPMNARGLYFTPVTSRNMLLNK